jgi:hypothetical protein
LYRPKGQLVNAAGGQESEACDLGVKGRQAPPMMYPTRANLRLGGSERMRRDFTRPGKDLKKLRRSRGTHH